MTFELTPRQSQVYEGTFQSGAQNVMLYGGSRSGKTLLALYVLVLRGLNAPGSRHLVARRYVNGVKTTIGADTLPKVLTLAFPGLPWRYAEQKGVFIIGGPRQEFEIWLGGLDDKEKIDKILGSEYATIYLNEVSEIGLKAATVLRTRLAQKVPALTGGTLSLRRIVDLNPGAKSHWSYVEHVTLRDPTDLKSLDANDYAVAQMNPGSNAANLDQAYLSSLAALPEAERRRFFDGEFSSSDTPNQVIPTAWVEAAMERWTPEGCKGPMTSLGVDVAMGGLDRLVCAPRYDRWFGKLVSVDGTTLIDPVIGTGSASKAAGVITGVRKNGAQINIDANGNGAGVASHLSDNGAHVLAMVGSRGTKARDKLGHYGFANLRAEIHWKFREMLDPENQADKAIALPPDEQLKMELTAPTYEILSGKYKIETKEDLIERIGRSPDLAEAVMNAGYSHMSHDYDDYDDYETHGRNRTTGY